MGHTFAGILGPLALLTCLARGAVQGASADSTLLAAWIALLAFSSMGYVVGWIAGSTVEESVEAQVAAELSIQNAKEEA